MTHVRLCRELALALLAGPWEVQALKARAGTALGTQKPWLGRSIDRVMERFPGTQAPPLRTLLGYLINDDVFFIGSRKNRATVHAILMAPTPMAPLPGAPASWTVPKLETESELCGWLDLPQDHLAWLADVHGRERQSPREALRNYRYTWIPKRSGGWRLLEIPKSKLKEVQRRLLSGLLDKIPAHPAAQGFRKGGSTYEFVLPHCGQHTVLRMDLADFFVSVQSSRVHALFRTAGYSEAMARLLTGLCTNSVPSRFLSPPDTSEQINPVQRNLLRTPHLPQGAPTSPALANLCAYRLDVRLSALARRFDWHYSRYADDLLFSGPRLGAPLTQQFQIWVGAAAIEEFFTANMRKTRVMRRSSRQRAAGLVVNTKPNVSRAEFDRLKAILHNCVASGPAGQNRGDHPHFREHLLGRIGHIEHLNPGRGKTLRSLFERIRWT